jgi:hypothetical protein
MITRRKFAGATPIRRACLLGLQRFAVSSAFPGRFPYEGPLPRYVRYDSPAS